MDQAIYKIQFINHDHVYEMYVKHIFQSEIYGFIEVEEFLFDERSQMIVDPGEEKLKNEFSGVKRSFIPMHSVIRIDEVEKQGQVKVSDNKAGGNVSAFPMATKPSPK